MPSTKIHGFETSYGRKEVINRKCLLNELETLHVHANEVQRTKAMERLSNDCCFSRDWVLYFQERQYAGSLDIFLQSQDSQPLL